MCSAARSVVDLLLMAGVRMRPGLSAWAAMGLWCLAMLDRGGVWGCRGRLGPLPAGWSCPDVSRDRCWVWPERWWCWWPRYPPAAL